MSRTISVSEIAQIAVVAAIYAVMTICLAPLSYGAVQVRLSEVLMLLCIYRKRWCISLTIGCMIANLFSGIAVDFLFGTAATCIAAFLMLAIRKPLPASLIPAVINGLLIGAELRLFADVPFFLGMLGVAAGEIIAVSVIGLPMLRAAQKSDILCRLIGMPRRPKQNSSDSVS